jgi:hypothetical protein
MVASAFGEGPGHMPMPVPLKGIRKTKPLFLSNVPTPNGVYICRVRETAAADCTY